MNDIFILKNLKPFGLPSVAHCADELNLSPNYFGDLVKKENIAKEKIFDTSKTVSQVAYELGFKYPQHFARLFKQRVGQSPLEFRTLN